MDRGALEGRHAVDAPTAVAAASYLIALNQLIVNVQPLILGALADDYGLTDRQLGHVSAVFVGFNTLCMLSAPLWVRRVNWRWLSLLAVVGATLILAGGAAIRTGFLFLPLFALLGAVKGGFGTPSFASLGDTSNPDRTYGVSVVIQGLVAALAAAPLSAYVIPQYGVPGLFITLAICIASGTIACHWLPTAGRIRALAQAEAPTAPVMSAAAIPAALALVALALFVAGILGFWYFVERIGVARGTSAGVIGLTLSVGALASIFTAGVVAWLGGRIPSLAFVAGGTLMVLVAFAVLQATGDVPFMAANLLFALGWGLAQPAYWAVARKVDATNRLFVAASAASGSAGVFIGMVAGPVIERGGYAGLILFSAVLLSSGALVLTLASRLATRPRRPERRVVQV